jgi:hypothetical protein
MEVVAYAILFVVAWAIGNIWSAVAVAPFLSALEARCVAQREGLPRPHSC